MARYIPDRKAPEGHHALSQLVQQGSPAITDAFPDARANYNLAAGTRMDWDHNAHILETFATHGGRDALTEYFSRSPHLRDDLELRYLENRAKQVFARLKYMVPREDLNQQNWQMGHITKLAAQRVRNFMTSGPHALRSFQAREGSEREHVAQRRGDHHTPSYNRYHLPLASQDQFVRMSKLPGMHQYLRSERGKAQSRVPWAYQGPERYKQLHQAHSPFPHEELHGER